MTSTWLGRRIAVVFGVLAIGVVAVIGVRAVREWREPEPMTPLAAGAELIADVAYGEHPRQRYDVYLPADGEALPPVVVYIHGGGWRQGDKSWDMPVWDWTEDGYAVVAINYRFAEAPLTVADSTADAIAAVEHLLAEARAGRVPVDADRVGVYGFSAGGHLAAMVGAAVPEVVAVVASAAPTEFGDLTDPERSVFEIRTPEDAAAHVRGLLGCGEGDCAQAIEAVSPARVPPGPAPVLVLHGVDDVIVDPSQAEALAAHLEAAGVDVTLELVPDWGHWPMLDEERRAFFAEHVRGR